MREDAQEHRDVRHGRDAMRVADRCVFRDDEREHDRGQSAGAEPAQEEA